MISHQKTKFQTETKLSLGIHLKVVVSSEAWKKQLLPNRTVPLCEEMAIWMECALSPTPRPKFSPNGVADSL